MTILSGAVLSEMSVDDLLLLDVNDMEAVVDFVPMPTGFYRFSVKACTMEEMGDDKVPAIQVEVTLTENTELANPEKEEDAEIIATAFADGATVKHVENFFLKGNNKSAYGVRAFATMFKALVPEGQKANVPELMELAVGSSGTCLIEKSSWIPKGKTEEDRKWGSRIKPTAVAFD